MNVLTERYNPWKNHEGYNDPTAYKAIYGEKNMDYVPGDIVEIELNNGLYRDCVIIATHMKQSTALMLVEDEAPENNHKVDDGTTMNCDVGRPITLYYDKIRRYMRSMPDEAFQSLLKHMVQALGYTGDGEPIVKEVPVVKEVVKEVAADPTEMIRVQTERDIYKDLYMRAMKGEFV